MFERSTRRDTGCLAFHRCPDTGAPGAPGTFPDNICRAGAIERSELAAFFRELGLGWEIDAEGLVDRLAGARGVR